MDKLIRRLEDAPGPDARLDADIVFAILGATPFPANFHGCVTRSIDDAFVLCPDCMSDWLIYTHRNPPSIGAEITLKIKRKKASREMTFQALGANGGLALTAAALKALKYLNT